METAKIQRVSMDHARKALETDNSHSGAAISATIFDLLKAFVDEILNVPRSLICEGPFADSRRRKELCHIAARNKCISLSVRLVASSTILSERLLARIRSGLDAEGDPGSNITEETLGWFQSLYELPSSGPLPGEIVFNTEEMSVDQITLAIRCELQRLHQRRTA